MGKAASQEALHYRLPHREIPAPDSNTIRFKTGLAVPQ
jgi:hypothetical protein